MARQAAAAIWAAALRRTIVTGSWGTGSWGATRSTRGTTRSVTFCALGARAVAFFRAPAAPSPELWHRIEADIIPRAAHALARVSPPVPVIVPDPVNALRVWTTFGGAEK